MNLRAFTYLWQTYVYHSAQFMSPVLSSISPFPNIAWWAAISDYKDVLFDAREHFEKMSCHNKYYINGANGVIQLSIPLVNGRNQRAAVKDIRIFNESRWRVQHWRTLVSVYKRSPFFDHYEPELERLFNSNFEYLVDFSAASIEWLKKSLSISFTESQTNTYQESFEGKDLRPLKMINYKNAQTDFPRYYQLFSERNGFVPNLSILDLLFSEGTHSLHWISMHKHEILQRVQ